MVAHSKRMDKKRVYLVVIFTSNSRYSEQEENTSKQERKMNVLVNLARIPSDRFMISLLATISAVFGCGVMPADQMSTRNFAVTGFTLPVAMVSTAHSVQSQVPGMATSETGAAGFVQRLVLRTVFDVLESQARSALLPDASFRLFCINSP
ncbi:hypothetical protein KIN20_021793 [Parelaphostrongylus tenuis]|uniref:Uncharacterized protein n=1 Tax=Parelaphostrongylus tenuis TaxID=148309 RepID=A0AAD5N7D6_PARTN|nr:hypothetical protein KIN20_021793 [Parelaphostrongylus tenuis]